MFDQLLSSESIIINIFSQTLFYKDIIKFYKNNLLKMKKHYFPYVIITWKIIINLVIMIKVKRIIFIHDFKVDYPFFEIKKNYN